MVGVDEELVEGEGYVVVQPRWKEVPDVIEFEFVAVQRSEYDLETKNPLNSMHLNIKATPNQIKVLKQFRLGQVSMVGPNGNVEELDIVRWGLSRYSPGPRGHWCYHIWTPTFPGPDSLVRLRLIPDENGGDH